MNRFPILLALTLGLVACNTLRLSDAETLALYQEHAGEPVKHFQFYGQISGWTPLGNEALAVWTRPNQAYLLQLYGTCQDLDFAPAISLSNLGSRVSAGFDKVFVHGGGTSPIKLPCRIQTIRPLDVKSLKQAQKEMREAQVVERDADGN